MGVLLGDALRQPHEAHIVSLNLYKQPKLLDYLKVCIDAVDDIKEQYEAVSGLKYDPERIAAQHAMAPGPAWVLCEGETPIVVAGFHLQRPGVWQEYLFSTHRAWAYHALGTTRYVKRVMDAMMKSEAHRIECISLVSRAFTHDWLSVLGFEPEGTLRAYGANGEDAIMFARVRAGDGFE